MARAPTGSPAEVCAWADAAAVQLEADTPTLPLCPTCSGKGWTGATNASRWCPQCRGLGHLRHTGPVCATCGTAGWVRSSESTDTRVSAAPCPHCDDGRDNRRRSAIMASGIPPSMAAFTIDTFLDLDGLSPSQRAAGMAAAMLADAGEVADPATGEARPGLLLTGPNGIGKTGLAVGLLCYLRPRDALFLNWPAFVGDLQSTYSNDDPRSADELIDEAVRAPILVLDDIGAVKVTDDQRRMLYELANARQHMPGGLTVVTSNLSATVVGGTVRGELVEAFGEHNASRLAGMCAAMAMTGADARVAA